MSAQPSTTTIMPEPGWSQIKETIRMLSLAVAQLDMVMSDGDDSVSTLTDSFTSMASEVNIVEKITAEMEADNIDVMKKLVTEHCQAINDKMGSVIVAFQFYDRLSQRLAHVSNSLGNLGELVSNEERLINPTEWQGLQEQIRSRYTIESDKIMFDALMSGSSVEDALVVWRSTEPPENQSKEDDIELF